MDEIWERAVETALDGETDHAAVRNLTLDGAVKCVHGRLPHPSIFERFPNLQHLSLANIGVSSLEQFPRLGNLQKLVLSDNRIAGGLECLVDAGLRSLVDLDLSNNRIQYIEDLAPLAEFQLVSLDLYECPVTRVKDYRARVFGLIKSLKYLDKMDAEENETPESDDEEEEDEEEEEDDPGSGEVDGGDRPFSTENGRSTVVAEGILDVDDEEDEESDADEEETELARNGQSSHHESNGFRLVRADKIGDEEDDDEIEEEDNSSGEEIDEEDADEDEVVEVHEIADSDDDDDGVEYEDEEADGDEDDDEEEVDKEERDMGLPSSTGQLASTEGEIDGHEQGEDDVDEDDNGETGEEDDQGVEEEVGYEEEDAEEDDDDDEENGSGYLVQPVNQQAIADEVDDELSGGSDMDPVNDEEDEEGDEDLFGEEDVEDDLQDDDQVGQFQIPPSSSSSHFKRKRSNEDDEDEESDDSDDDGGDGGRQSKMPKNDE